MPLQRKTDRCHLQPQLPRRMAGAVQFSQALDYVGWERTDATVVLVLLVLVVLV